MASLSQTSGGSWRVQFMAADGKRRGVLLGSVPRRTAESLCGKIEHLVSASITKHALDRETAAWVAGLDRVMVERLVDAGLLSAENRSMTLGEFLASYVEGRGDVKASTQTVYGHTHRCLIEFFGADKLLRGITPGDATRWRIWLTTEANTRDKARDDLASNTVNRRCGIAKQFFRAAIRDKLIEANPFADLTAQVRGNRARQYFVPREAIELAIAAAPDVEWRLIIALARYGGLRIPSELLTLRWADVNLPERRMVIHASKTEHHDSAGIRVCPIFPELLPYMEAAWDAAKPGAEFVIARYRKGTVNLRSQFNKILKRAGIAPWPKLFHNLRATRQTELLDYFPVKAVCDWLGNSAAVAMEHYAMATVEHFASATTLATIKPSPTTASAIPPVADAPAVACANPVQSVQESRELEGTASWAIAENVRENEGESSSVPSSRPLPMGGTGLEPVTPTV